MTWEYLNEETDHRFVPIAAYLKGKTKDKMIIDLDCLEGRILNFLDHDYLGYKGNDILIDRFVGGYKATIKQQTSKNFVKTIHRCDILLLLGYTGDHPEVSEKEDHDLTNSAKYMVDRFEPGIIVLECWLDYRHDVNELSEYLKGFGYKEAVQQECLSDSGNRMHQRYLVILEK